MKYIELSSNQFESIPDCIFILPSLKQLTLRGNYIDDLSGITGLRNLEFLDLSGNNVLSLPNELGDLPKLKKLILKGNPVSAEELKRFKE